MQCPIDQAVLAMTERQGIEIDYCPKCRGVWLDRGELDKLIEAGAAERPHSGQSDRAVREEDRRYSSDDRYKYEKKRKKESFLGDLFDF